MSAAKHTPGPWRIEADYLDFRILAGAHVAVARVVGDARTDTEERRAMVADASLISAAPDLYEALDDLSGFIRRGWTLADDIEVSRALDRAEAALKKARGE